MSTKTITAWINGSVQSIQVPDIADVAHDPTLEERVETLESRTVIISSVSLPSSAWSGSGSTYTQEVTINGITERSIINLQPSPEQLVELQDAEIALMIVNNNGIATAYAMNYKPTKDYEMQVLITEVVNL